MSAESIPSPPAGERDIFWAALETPGKADRARFVAEACGADATLLARVDALLREYEAAGDFLDSPVVANASGASAEAGLTERPGDRIGRFKLLEKIGEGGSGAVYMAEQLEPVRRRVALKILKLGMDTRSVIARFEAERQALAIMDHPNIAKVFDAGASETGRPYFVMELVRGVKLTDYCDENSLSTEERLALFIQICQAIQHAHQKGIIHRDLKPSNILVTVQDGSPIPKIIDFGIAKATQQALTDKTLFTEFRTFIGTPAYMSPEQAEMSSADVDTRSDIYSLGVLLYELLTGRTPFDATTLARAGLDECRRIIRETEPSRPSARIAGLRQTDLTTTANRRRTDPRKLAPFMRGELDWIAMKCLEKDRNRRYPSANDVALDIHRFLASEPVLARPPSTAYRLGKLLHRHRLAVAAVVSVTAALLLAVIASTRQALLSRQAEREALASELREAKLRHQADLQRNRATENAALARLNEYVADMNLAQHALAAGNFGRAVQLVKRHFPKPGEEDLRGFEWKYLWRLCQGDTHTEIASQVESVYSLAYSPNRELVAIGSREKIVVLNAHSKSAVATMNKGALSLGFSNDGKALYGASFSSLRVWSTTNWSETAASSECFAPLALSANGRHLAVMSRDGVRLCTIPSLATARLFPQATGPLTFSPDGARLAARTRAGITLWTVDNDDNPIVLEDSSERGMFNGPFRAHARVLVFSPDGKYIIAPASAGPGASQTLRVWDAKSGVLAATLPQDSNPSETAGVISSVAVSPNAATIAAASWDHSIRLWDLSSRQFVRRLQGHLNEVWMVEFSPDGEQLLSGAKDGGVNLWPLRRDQNDDSISGAWQPLMFSKDGRRLAAVGSDGAVGLYNVATGELEKQLNLRVQPGPGPALAISESLNIVAQRLPNGTIQILNTETEEASTLDPGRQRPGSLSLSPDGRLLVLGGFGRPAILWSLPARTNMVLAEQSDKALFSPRGDTLAVFQPANRIQIWRTSPLSMVKTLTNVMPSHMASFSPDGSMLALASSPEISNSIGLLDIATGKLIGVCSGHKQGIFPIAFSPDGKTLASASGDNTIKLWNVATQQEVLTFPSASGARTLLFSPDGEFLAIGQEPSRTSRGLRLIRAAAVY